MALITGFLKQKCTWTTGGTLDNFGQATGTTTKTIKCRWTANAGFTDGTMGAGTGTVSLAYRNVVFVDGTQNDVQVGDTLMLNGQGGKVLAVNTYIMPSGKEGARKCYV